MWIYEKIRIFQNIIKRNRTSIENCFAYQIISKFLYFGRFVYFCLSREFYLIPLFQVSYKFIRIRSLVFPINHSNETRERSQEIGKRETMNCWKSTVLLGVIALFSKMGIYIFFLNCDLILVIFILAVFSLHIFPRAFFFFNFPSTRT